MAGGSLGAPELPGFALLPPPPARRRGPLPRRARRGALTMACPLWLACRPPSGCRPPACRRLLPVLAAAAPWRRALPARPGRPGSLAEVTSSARSLAPAPLRGGPGAAPGGAASRAGKGGTRCPTARGGEGAAEAGGGVGGTLVGCPAANAWLPAGTQGATAQCPPTAPGLHRTAPATAVTAVLGWPHSPRPGTGWWWCWCTQRGGGHCAPTRWGHASHRRQPRGCLAPSPRAGRPPGCGSQQSPVPRAGMAQPGRNQCHRCHARPPPGAPSHERGRVRGDRGRRTNLGVPG